MSKISIAGLDKAEVLAALYNRSKQQGMGFMHLRGAEQMTVSDARAEIAYLQKMSWPLYFDYLHGRVMKVDLSGDEFYFSGYDCDVGQGAAAEVIAKLRSQKEAA